VLHTLEHQPRQLLTTLSFKIGLQDDGALVDALITFTVRHNESAALPATALAIAEVFDRTIDDRDSTPAPYTDETSLYKDVIKALQLLDDDPDLQVELRDQYCVLSHYKLLQELFEFSDRTTFEAQ
jgi:hypothetical protein